MMMMLTTKNPMAIRSWWNELNFLLFGGGVVVGVIGAGWRVGFGFLCFIVPKIENLGTQR